MARAKKQRRKREHDPLAGKPPPRWGATQAQGRRNARERELQNYIHKLEGDMAAANAAVNNLIDARDKALRERDAMRPTAQQLTALRRVCSVPLTEWVRLEQTTEIENLSLWALDLSRWLVQLDKVKD